MFPGARGRIAEISVIAEIADIGRQNLVTDQHGHWVRKKIIW